MGTKVKKSKKRRENKPAETSENTGRTFKIKSEFLRGKTLDQLWPLLILAIALVIRLIPYRLKYLIGYDPYFHLAYLEYVTSHGWVNYFPYALGPWGFLINHFHPKGMWGLPYVIYLLGKPLGLSVSGAFKLTPPIVGTATIAFLYLFMKTLYGKREALLASLFLTISFGHVFRSMASYYRGDNYALLFYTVVLYVLVRALKEREWRKKLAFYAISGIVAGISSIFWSAYYIVLTLPLAIAVGIALYSLIEKERFIDSAMMSVSVALGATVASILGRIFGFGMFWVENWQGEQLAAFTGLPAGPLEDEYLAILVLLLIPTTLLLIGALWALRKKVLRNEREITKTGIAIITILTLLMVSGVILWRYGKILGMLSSGLSSFGGPAVAEMSRPGFWDLKMAYYSLIILVPLQFISLRRAKCRDILSLIVSLPLILLALYWTRFLFIGSLGIAVAASIGSRELLEIAESREKALKNAVILLIGIIVLSTTYHTVVATKDIRPIVNDNWAEALTYLRAVSTENDVVLTWWDHGHWVTYFAHRAPVSQGTPNEFVARFYLGNTTMKELMELGVDYVTVSFDTMLKWGSVKSTAGYKGKEYVLLLLPFRTTYQGTLLFGSGKYTVAVKKAENGWNVLVNANGVEFVPEEVWIEDKIPFKANVTGKKAGNAYVYVNLKYGYAVLMDGKTYSTPFAKLMFTKEYPANYTLVYSDGGMVKIFRLNHPNVALSRGKETELILDGGGDRLRIYGYTDSGERVFYREYPVNGTEFKLPPEVKGEVIRYTYLKGDTVLDRGVFRRANGWD